MTGKRIKESDREEIEDLLKDQTSISQISLLSK